jgi:tetratricopeptide (TPR) repeat protein
MLAIAVATLAAAGQPDDQTAPATRPAGDTANLVILERAVSSAPDSVAARRALADELLRQGEYTGVVDALTPVSEALDTNDTLTLSRALVHIGKTTQAADLLRQALNRTPDQAPLWTELVQLALDSERYGLALRRVQEARAALKSSTPRLSFQAATARFHLGQSLGATSVREFPDGRPGQFVGKWLLVEQRGDKDRFLCCPRESALYQLRRALDGGLDDQAADCLHAAIWAGAGRPEVGLRIIKSREAAWREGPTVNSLKTLAELSLACGKARDYLSYSRRLARRDPETAENVMYEAYVSAAKLYNQRGEQTMYRELLRRALEIRQDDVELMLSLGDTIWETGDHEGARAWYRRMLSREPDHPQRIRIMKRLED